MKLIVLILFSCALWAHAQSYTIQEPGKLPTYVRTTSSGVTIDYSGSRRCGRGFGLGVSHSGFLDYVTFGY